MSLHAKVVGQLIELSYKARLPTTFGNINPSLG